MLVYQRLHRYLHPNYSHAIIISVVLPCTSREEARLGNCLRDWSMCVFEDRRVMFHAAAIYDQILHLGIHEIVWSNSGYSMTYWTEWESIQQWIHIQVMQAEHKTRNNDNKCWNVKVFPADSRTYQLLVAPSTFSRLDMYCSFTWAYNVSRALTSADSKTFDLWTNQP